MEGTESDRICLRNSGWNTPSYYNNLSVDQSFDIDTTIIDRSVKTVKGEIVTEEIHAKNTFEEPECVTVKKYDGTQITEKGIRFTIPACSVLHLEVR